MKILTYPYLTKSIVCVFFLFVSPLITKEALGSDSLLETQMAKVSFQGMTLAEATLKLQEQFYEETGEKLPIFISPELALSENKQYFTGKNFSVERIVDFLAEMHGAKAIWIDEAFLLTSRIEE